VLLLLRLWQVLLLQRCLLLLCELLHLRQQ
jgi:hypothetical protein